MAALAAAAALTLGACGGEGSPDANGSSQATPTAGSPTTDPEGPAPVIPKSTWTDPPAASNKPGSIRRTVAPPTAKTQAPVAVTAPGQFGNKVSAAIQGRKPVTVKGQLPGETSGPGLALTVKITNGSAKAINLDTVLVDLQKAQGVSADPVLSPPAKPMAGQLAAGESATGTYVFTLADADRRNCTVRVSYTAEAPTVVFAGDLG